MYTLEKEKNNKYVAKITVSMDEWENYINSAYEKMKHKFNVGGFRKGKAPRKIIEQNFGQNVFFDDALEMAFYDEYEKIIINEKEIEPVNAPQINLEKFDETGLVFNVEIQSVPEVKLGEYRGLKIEAVKGEVAEKTVDAEINQQRNRLARFEVIDKEANLGNFVTIDFIGSVEGKEFEGGKAENYRLELGSKSFIEGFEEQVVGMKAGDKKVIKVTFPSDYFAPDLKGKLAEFKVTVKKVEQKELPELDDKFASNVSEFETMQEYRASVRKHLEESLQSNLKRETENKLIDAIVETSEIDVPDSMAEQQLESFIKDFETKLSYQGLTLQDYLNQTKSTIEEIKKEQKENAVNTIKTRLVLEKIIKNEDLYVKSEELDKKIAEIASKYKKSPDDYKKSLGERELIYFENGILMDKLISFLMKENEIIENA